MAEGQDLQNTCVGKRYRITQKLFSGFYGTCWKAVDIESKKDVCIKTFFADNKDQTKELSILAEFVEGHFHHENLCEVLRVSLEKEPVYTNSNSELTRVRFVSFEFCSGTDLFNFLVTGPYEKEGQSNPFREPLAHHYFTQVLLAVMYLHARGVYHRDIKPENCVLDHHFNLKLTDFGTNKIMHNQEMSEVLRTSTHNIGTNCYRSPELCEKGRAYDPGFADVWSLGITLFFFVGIDVMVKKCKLLDPYMRRMIAPLGIYFPFPVHCAKLDSYFGTDKEIVAQYNYDGSLKCKALKNKLFWSEWAELQATISKDLIDLFNRIFLLPPQIRITLSDMLNHKWMANPSMSPARISQEMLSRKPSGVECHPSPQPSSLPYPVTGGCDQASLRRNITNGYNIEFPCDSEVWSLLDGGVDLLIRSRTDLVEPDVQSSLSSISVCQNILHRIAQKTCDSLTLPAKNRKNVAVFLQALQIKMDSDGVVEMKPCNGILVQKAADVLKELERALTSGIVVFRTSYFDDYNMDMDIDDSDVPTPTPSDVPPTLTRADHDLKDVPMKMDSGHVTLPEHVMIDRLKLTDSKPIQRETGVRLPTERKHHYTASYEFTKMSMLLTSYGVRQFIAPSTLTVYCSGRRSSFYVQVLVDNQSLNLFSDCFYGNEEWNSLMKQLLKDFLC